jgi:hypothetical protein
VDDDQLVEAWRHYRRQLRAEGVSRLGPIDFDAFRVRQETDTASDLFAFSSLAGDYLRELINFLNGWGYHIDCLASWCVVLESHDSSDQLYLIHEFVGPLMESVLERPYQARSRFTYCTARLFELVAPHPGAKRAPLRRRDITGKTLEALIGSRRGGTGLLAALGHMNSQEFRKATAEFRNRLHHGLPPRLGQGLFWRIRRSYPDARTTQTDFGLQPPLPIEPLIPHLLNEHRAATGAYDALWALVQEVMCDSAAGTVEQDDHDV